MCCPLPFPPPQAGEGQGGGSGRTRKARQNSTLRLSAFRLRIFLSFFPSSLPDIAVCKTASFHSPMPAIHAEISLAQRFHRRLRKLKLRIELRVKPGGVESESSVTVASHSSDAKSHRENEILFPSRPRAQRVVGRG